MAFVEHDDVVEALPTDGADQAPDRWVNAWSTSFGPALPAPVGPKSSAVPSDDGGRFDENEGPAPTLIQSPIATRFH